jgi:CheY-like chemotaxis protein
LVVLETTCWETADALSDELRPAGYATAWAQFGRPGPQLRGAAAGIWEGRQLDEPDALRLTAFCRRLAGDGAPVVALLDFPRRDRVERARQAGAAAVLGKPWLSADLLAMLTHLIAAKDEALRAATVARAA